MNTYYLACEGGATHTVAGIYDVQGHLIGETEGPPCNPVAYGLPASISALTTLGRHLIRMVDGPVVAAAGISGARTQDYWSEIGQALCETLRVRHAVVTTDIHPLLAANTGERPGILAVAGTGATVLAKNGYGEIIQTGGRGKIFGEEGSAYAIAVNAMRSAAHSVDGIGPKTILAETLPQSAGVATLDDLVPWSVFASKSAIADLARAVDAAAEAGDHVARNCIEEQARWLAIQVVTVQERMHFDELSEDTEVFLQGGVFRSCKAFRWAFQVALDNYNHLTLTELRVQGHKAVLPLAMMAETPSWAGISYPGGESLSLPRTERRAELVKTLDRMTPLEIAGYMNAEDRRAVRAVGQQAEHVAAAVDLAAASIRAGGRIIYAGAGTSGRLGVLDAAECPPTFGVSPDRVVALLAGGEAALRRSVEGAEDNTAQAVADIQALGVAPRDLVIGIAASGSTPYVLAALEEAVRAGAKTAMICCNPSRVSGADVVIALDTGPEILAGSTRLKAGTATKVVLNTISTGAMALSGYVHEGFMVGMVPVNKKLRRRAARMVATLAELSYERAESLLQEADYRIAVAVLMGWKGVEMAAAEAELKAAGGILREALESGMAARQIEG